MELNLTRLNSLAFVDFTAEAPEKQPSETPTETLLGQEEYKSSSEQENALKRQLEGLQGLQRKADYNKAQNDRNLEIYREYQDNIKRSGSLRTDILKGARAGEDIYSLFLKAVECISRMTSDKLFYSQIEEDIKTIYGRGLQEEAPLLLEIAETEERLYKLRQAQERETETDSRERIKKAVQAHERRIAELKALITGQEAEEKPA